MSDNLDNLISVPEAAKRAGVARNTMHRAVKDGTIKGRKLGRDWFIDATDIERWQKENYRPGMARRYPAKGHSEDHEQS